MLEPEDILVEFEWISKVHELCEAKPHYNPIPLMSITTKYKRAKYYEELIEDIIDDPKEYDIDFIRFAHIVSAFQNIHSMGDLLGQVLNNVVLNGQMDIADVSLTRVKNRLNTNTLMNIKRKIENLLNAYEWKFVNEFTNTEKHRFTIDISTDENGELYLILDGYRDTPINTYTFENVKALSADLGQTKNEDEIKELTDFLNGFMHPIYVKKQLEKCRQEVLVLISHIGDEVVTHLKGTGN